MTRDPAPESDLPHPSDNPPPAAFFKSKEPIPFLPSVAGLKQRWAAISRQFDKLKQEAEEQKPPGDVLDPWRVARDFHASDQALQLMVTSFNKGGLLVEWNGLQGFVPASQLLEFPKFHLEAERLRALRKWNKKLLRLKIIEVDESANRLILSERAALVKAQKRADLLASIKKGEVLTGEVTNLTVFGAFLDLGGIEGLVHISELSWGRVEHPSNVVRPGDKVRVEVINVDTESGRIALSMKRLRPDPWKTATKRYRPGQLVEGVVSNVTHFGAFVLLEAELEGLIHISELADEAPPHPSEVITLGQKVTVQVLAVNGKAKRLALSLRRVSSPQNGH